MQESEMEFASYISMLPMLVLVVARIAGMVIFAPVLGEAAVPARLRILLALVMALGVMGQLSPVAVPTAALPLVLAIVTELLIGLAIGYAARLIFVGVEIGAFHISTQMGLSLGEVFNPLSEESSDAVRQFFRMLTLVIFLAIGGHRLLIGGLLKSFSLLPVLGLAQSGPILTTITSLLAASFVLALKVAAPVLIALLAAGAALGFIQRTLPQLNTMSVGLPARIMLGLTVIVAMLAMGNLPELMGAAGNVVASQLREMMGGLH